MLVPKIAISHVGLWDQIQVLHVTFETQMYVIGVLLKSSHKSLKGDFSQVLHPCSTPQVEEYCVSALNKYGWYGISARREIFWKKVLYMGCDKPCWRHCKYVKECALVREHLN